MQVKLGVRFCKAFISKNYAFESLADSAQNRAILQRLNALKKDLDLSFIPPIERRRLSDASKIAFSLLGSSSLKIPIIFSSQKGEINRCFAMLNDLASHNITSPTAFSLSVLNSTPALLAIAQKNHSEILAISAVDCLEYGLINAYALLSESSGANCKLSPKDCLIISYEEALHSKDICVVMACVSLDFSLPQIAVELRKDLANDSGVDSPKDSAKDSRVDSHKDSHNDSPKNLANLSSNLSFLFAMANSDAHYQNGDFAIDLSDFLKGFNLANI